jgi:ribosomal RNA-processing protein 9
VPPNAGPALSSADLVAAQGSWDGEVRLWGLDQGLRTFSLLFSVPAVGFVNSLQLVRPRLAPLASSWRRRGGLTAATASSESDVPGPAEEANGDANGTAAEPVAKKERSPLLIVALGQEPRLGRWMRQPAARNGALVVPLALS